MILQNLTFPKAGICSLDEMYFRADHNKCFYLETEECITFNERGNVWFDTYFNGLSIEKWTKYTVVSDVNITLTLQGKFLIRLIAKEKIHDRISEKVLSVTDFESTEKKSITLPFHSFEKKGMYFFSLEALENDSKLFGGYYSSEISEDKLRDVNIAINICTYKRDLFIERNLKIITEAVLSRKDQPLSEHLQIFISDNGQTLDINELSNDHVHIVKNKNAGGAGGFARGLIEIMNNSSFQATHVLFMDDDVLIAPESLYRTYAVLRCLKEEYTDLFIGGAMLRLDQQNIQVEAGASWNAGALVSNKSGLDLCSVDACLYNEVEEYAEYNAWWYCCAPINKITPENLPMPVFIRGDDVEFGLRNMEHLMLLNGICVWHEPFENKYSSFLSYYILRNMLYNNAVHCSDYSKMKLISRMSDMVLRELFMYRYKNADLIFRGINDFLKGVDFLLETDGEQLHREIMASGYKAQDIDQLDMPFSYPKYEYSLTEIDKGYFGFVKGFNRRLRVLGFNGLFLRANRQTVVSMAKCRPVNFYRAKKVMHYDITTRKAFITEKNVFTTLHYLWLLLTEIIKLCFCFDKAFQDFGKQANHLWTEEFWRYYLDLPEADSRKALI